MAKRLRNNFVSYFKTICDKVVFFFSAGTREATCGEERLDTNGKGKWTNEFAQAMRRSKAAD